jgi:hypothetical protein
MAGITVYTGEYIKTDAGFMRVCDVCEDCFGEMIVVFGDSTTMNVDEITLDMLYLESEVNV